MIFSIPQDQWYRIHDSTSDIVYAGSFTAPSTCMLKNIKMGFLKNECEGVFKIRIHTSDNFNKIYATSETIDLAEIPHDSFTGNVRFDFEADVNLISGRTYHITIEAVTYMRIGDTNFIGWMHDLPYPINTSTGNYPIENAFKMGMFIK